MFRMKGRLTAGVLCAMLAAMLVVPVSLFCFRVHHQPHPAGVAASLEAGVEGL